MNWLQLEVDMSKLSIVRRSLDDGWKELGGRALVAQYLMKNVPPTCDPLGEENTLVFCLPVFAGTILTTANRVSVGCKSPLTGGIKESSVDGDAGTRLAEQGIKLIAVKDLPQKSGCYLLRIDVKGVTTLENVDEYAGLDAYAFTAAMKKKYGETAAVLSIGVAGERKYKAASIQATDAVTGYPSRVAAKGGVGAVMGSKGLKGIVVEKVANEFKPDYANEELFIGSASQVNDTLAKASEGYPSSTVGTISNIDGFSKQGILPVQNFSGKLYADSDKVGAKTFLANLEARGGCKGQACQPGCVIKCSNVYNDSDKNYLTSGLDYETVALFGPGCMIDDLDKIAKMDRLCNELGVDTVEVACAIGVAMESGKLAWGDADGAIAWIEEIGKGTEKGKQLGDGCEATGLALGAARIPVVKHQALSAYEPRNTMGTGATMARNPQGPEAVRGLVIGATSDENGRAATVAASAKLQYLTAAANSYMCPVAFAPAMAALPAFVGMLMGLFGGEPDFKRVSLLGVTAVLTEQGFNRMAGLTPEEDKLPEFFVQEKSPATGAVYDINPYEIAVMFDV